MRFLAARALAGFVFLWAPMALWAVPQTGPYQISWNLPYSSCPATGADVGTALVTLSVTNTGDAIEATGTGTATDGDNVSLFLLLDLDGTLFEGTLDIGLNSLEPVSASINSLVSGGTGFSGTASGDAQVVSNTVDGPLPVLCFVSGTYTLTPLSTPDETPPPPPSVEAVNPITLQRQTTANTQRIFSRMWALRQGRATGATPTADGFMLQGGSGLNAGDDFASPVGGWLSYGFADFKDTSIFNFDGQRHSGLGGVDFMPSDQLIVGLAAGYDTVDVDTLFNRGNAQVDGFTVAPYIGYALNDAVSFDFTFGYSGLTTDQYRVDNSGRYDASVDSRRWFTGAGMNLLHNIDNWYLTGSAGWTWAREKIDGFTETGGPTPFSVGEQTARFAQWRAGGEVAYFLEGFEPFISATYQYDYQYEELTSNTGIAVDYDQSAVFFTSGFRYYVDNISASVEYTRLMARRNYSENGLNAALRIDF